MTPAELCRAVHQAGLRVRLDGDSLAVSPAGKMAPELREMLIAHKPELIAFLREAERTASELIEAAMVACDYHHDSEAARRQMRDECLALPPHLQADLLDHFTNAYRKDPS